MTAIQEAYLKVLNTPSDIQEHLQILNSYASNFRHITEFGVRFGTSTTALLAGQPDRLVCYDICDCPVVQDLRRMAGRTKFTFCQQDTLNADIEETDFLFIDDYHSGKHVYKELERHAPKVRKFIAFHDIVLFGVRGEKNDEEGILQGINSYLLGHPEWSVSTYRVNCNGLMIIKRSDEREVSH